MYMDSGQPFVDVIKISPHTCQFLSPWRERKPHASVNVVDKYFDMLEATMAEYALQSKLCKIFNMDKTGLLLDPKPPNIVCTYGEKNPSSIRAEKQDTDNSCGLCTCSKCSGLLYPSYDHI